MFKYHEEDITPSEKCICDSCRGSLATRGEQLLQLPVFEVSLLLFDQADKTGSV